MIQYPETSAIYPNLNPPQKKKSISPHEFEIPIKFLLKKKIVSDNPPQQTRFPRRTFKENPPLDDWFEEPSSLSSLTPDPLGFLLPFPFGKRQKRRKRRPAYIDRTRYTPDERNSPKLTLIDTSTVSSSSSSLCFLPSMPFPSDLFLFSSFHPLLPSLPRKPSPSFFESRQSLETLGRDYATLPFGIRERGFIEMFRELGRVLYSRLLVWSTGIFGRDSHYWLIARETITLVFGVCFWGSGFLFGR